MTVYELVYLYSNVIFRDWIPCRLSQYFICIIDTIFMTYKLIYLFSNVISETGGCAKDDWNLSNDEVTSLSQGTVPKGCLALCR